MPMLFGPFEVIATSGIYDVLTNDYRELMYFAEALDARDPVTWIVCDN